MYTVKQVELFRIAVPWLWNVHIIRLSRSNLILRKKIEMHVFLVSEGTFECMNNSCYHFILL